MRFDSAIVGRSDGLEMMVSDAIKMTKEIKEKIGVENATMLRKGKAIMDRIEDVEVYKSNELALMYNDLAPEDIDNPINTGMMRNFLEDVIKKDIVLDFDNVCYPDKPVVPFTKIVQDRCVLEIQRGCIRECRFCQAGSVYKPLREKSLETLKEIALTQLQSTGHDEISLSSLSTSDYSKLKELIDFLIEECKKKKINISLPSLRIDAFSLDVMSKVQDVKKSSITFAPEAGTQRMRNVINKGLTKEDIEKNLKPELYVGRAPRQVEVYLKDVVNPVLDAHKDELGVKAEINV